MIDKEILKEYNRNRLLVEKWGSLSWDINEIVEELISEKISESFFREKIRELLDKNCVLKKKIENE